jgi:hypothetical protein
VNEQGDRIYVLGEHSNVYTLNGSDFACLGVYYLGHSAGGVVVPAETVVNKLMVADNSGAETCTVRALTLNERGIITGELTSQRLNGLVTTPRQTAGRRLAVVTTLGQAMVFEVGPGSDKSSVAIIAKRDASEKEPMDHYALLHEGHLWIAGHQLMKLAILPTGNQLPTRTLDRNFRGDAFDYPLQAVGNLVVHVHRPAGQGGDTVSAMDAAANRSLWDISLAVPPAGAPAADPESLRLVGGSVLGAVYQLDREAMTRRVQDQAQRLDGAAPKTPLADSLDLGQGRLVLGGVGATQMICFVPTDARQPLKAVELPGPATSPPVAWRDGFAVPTEVGQVALYQADGSALATPFQPELTPGRKYEWLRPAVTGTQEQSQLIVSDGVAKLYLVNFELQPQPHLKAAAAADVGATPLETPLAVAGTTVYGGNKKGQLSGFTLPGLTAKEPVDLGGRVVWGPHPTGDGLLLTTERNELLFIASDGAIRWRQPVKHGELAGAPLVDGPSIFVLSRNGGIARINLADGAEAAYSDFAEPAVAGPVAFGPRLVISAHDGTLLVVNRP